MVWAGLVINVALVAIGWFITVAGTYSSIQSIADSFREGDVSSPWSCADNSNSV